MARNDVRLIGGPLDGYEIELPDCVLIPGGDLKMNIPTLINDGEIGERQYVYAYDGQHGTSREWIYHTFRYKQLQEGNG